MGAEHWPRLPKINVVRCFEDGCGKRAVYQVLNSFGQSCGTYCKPHGQAAWRRQVAMYQEERKKQRAFEEKLQQPGMMAKLYEGLAREAARGFVIEHGG